MVNIIVIMMHLEGMLLGVLEIDSDMYSYGHILKLSCMQGVNLHMHMPLIL